MLTRISIDRIDGEFDLISRCCAHSGHNMDVRPSGTQETEMTVRENICSNTLHCLIFVHLPIYSLLVAVPIVNNLIFSSGSEQMAG